jgi:hypothetical protein
MRTKAPLRHSFGSITASILLILLAANGTYAAQNTTLSNADDKGMEAKFNKYSLPYGVLGAISHLLTYWGIICHYYGRRPIAPWKHLKKPGFNMYGVVISSLVSITIAIVTLSRVRETQPLVVLAALQIVLGAVVDALSVHRFLSKQEGLIRGTVLWGAILYGLSYASIYAMAQMSSRLTASYERVWIKKMLILFKNREQKA